jgi:hypothetical protein
MAARTSKQILAALATLQTGQAQLLDVVARIEQLLTGGIRDAAELDLLGALSGRGEKPSERESDRAYVSVRA